MNKYRKLAFDKVKERTKEVVDTIVKNNPDSELAVWINRNYASLCLCPIGYKASWIDEDTGYPEGASSDPDLSPGNMFVFSGGNMFGVIIASERGNMVVFEKRVLGNTLIVSVSPKWMTEILGSQHKTTIKPEALNFVLGNAQDDCLMFRVLNATK